MDNVKCSICGSTDLTYDKLSDMYACSGCSRLLEPSEVVECVEDECIESGEELNGFSLFILDILMMIPLINVVIVMWINGSDVKYQYKKTFCYRAIVDVLIGVTVLVCVMHLLVDSKDRLRSAAHDIVDNLTIALCETKIKEVDFESLVSKDVMSTIESNVPITEGESSFMLSWLHMDGVIMSGKQVTTLLNEVGEDIAILVQTDGIRDKYTDKTYRNVGYLVDGFEKLGTTDNYFYEGKLSEATLYVDDYGEYVYESTDDIYNRRYIYYINPKNNYEFYPLLTEEGILIGVALKEVE